jgi:transcription elongation GreA/GreB family factor
VSKAFTKEDDDAPVTPARRRGVRVPKDVPNYVTAAGERALRAEAEATTDRERALEIADHLATAIVMGPPPEQDRARVGFGARVTVEDEAGKRTTYRIVGAIEADPKAGAIYFQTPIAEELHELQVGDSVTLPRGDVEIVAIDYG